ncbi:MAG: HD domain-containing protein, partial [Candidatus Aadella gelida]|nr:HD domain-containing protein [Candidatus Aadella gelida]
EFPEKNDPGRSYKVVQEKVGKYLTRQVIIQKAVTLQVPWYNRKIALVLSEEKIRENLEEVKKIVPEIYKTLSKNIIRRGDDIICTHIENADIGKHIEALKFFREMIADTEINSEKMEKYILDFHSQMKDTTILEVKQGPRSEKHEEIFQKIIDEIFVEENRERIKEDPIKFAAHSFVKIVRAQPFYNGNHRVANIVMNFILIKNGLPQFMLNKDNAVRYYSLTNWYYLLKDRFDIGEITEFFRQEILSKQKEITQKESWYNPQIDIVIPKEAIRDELRKVVEMAPKISASMPEHEGIAESIDKKEVLEDVIPKKKKHEENFGSLIKRYVAWIMKNLKPIRSSVADIEELILSQGWQINSDEVREYVHKWKKIVDAYPPQGERIEQHAVRTALLSVMIYSRLKLNGDRTLKGLDEVVTAALAHDLGKTNKELLRYFLKKGLLFPSERERIKRHVKKSLTMLKNAGVHVNGNISKAIIEHHPEYGNGEPATEVSRVLYAADQIDARQDVSRSDRRKGSLARWDEEAILHNLVPALSREWIDEDIYGVLVALIREKNANYFKIITATYFLWERGLLWFRLKFWFRSRDKGSGEEIKKLQDAEKNVSIKTSTLPPTFSLGHWWYNRIRKLNLNDEEIWKRTATNIAPWVEEFVNIGIPYGMFALFERYGEVITLSGLTAFFATSIIVGTSFIFLHLFNRRGPPKEADSLRNKWSDVLQAPFMVYSLAFFFSSFGIVFLSEIPLLIRFIGVFVVAGGYHKLINCAIADLRSGEYVMLGSYHNKKEGFEHDSLSNVIKKGGVLVHELSNLFSGIYNEIELGAVQYILDKKDVPREFKEMQDASEKVNNGMKSMRGLIGELKRRSLGQEESPKSIKYNAMDEGALMTELASEAEKLAENLEYIKNCDIERLVPIFKGKGEAIRARLSFARIKARAFFLDKEFDTEGDQRPVNVNDTINLMRDCLGKRSSRVFFVPGDVRPVMADKMLLASVWDNLRKNALEAMDDAG